MRRCAPAAVLSVLVIVCAPAQATSPGREVSLPASEVKDTFFAWFLGLIAAGSEADVDNSQMREILPEFTSLLNVPFDRISRFALRGDPGSGRMLAELDFQGDVVVPVPFSILFYHPGSVSLTTTIIFDVARSTVPSADAGGDEAAGVPVFFLTLSEGKIFVDIDPWLEFLFSEQLEDVWISHFVFFRWKGHWVGMLEGKGNRTGRLKHAYFDFTTNTILFPVSDSLGRMGLLLDSSRP